MSGDESQYVIIESDSPLLQIESAFAVREKQTVSSPTITNATVIFIVVNRFPFWHQDKRTLWLSKVAVEY